MGWLDKFKKPPEAKGSPTGGTEVARLTRELKAAEWERRQAAAQRLGELGARAEAAIADLEEAICDENGEVCLAASDALSKIRKAAFSP